MFKHWLIASFFTASGCFSAATFAFDWMNSSPVFPFAQSVEDANAQKPEQSSVNAPEVRDEAFLRQIDQIDLEILMLKAELALQNSDLKGFQKYLEELKAFKMPDAFKQRLEELKSALPSDSVNPIFRVLGFQNGFEFPMNDARAVVAIVLPLSGKYEKVATQLLQSLRETLQIYGFQGQLVEFDSMAYPNAFRLWEKVKYYQPSFIFGPLQKSLIVEWHHLDTGVPTLYFNDIETTLYAYEKALSPSAHGQVRKVAHYLEQHGFERAVILTDSDEKGRALAAALQLFWNAKNIDVQLSITELSENLSVSLSSALGVSASQTRAAVLQRIVSRPVESDKRSRQDLQAIITLSSAQNAIQVSPILRFHQLDQVQHFWFPSKTLRAQDLALFQHSWQSTTGFLPPYVVDAFRVEESDQENQTGIFYALGQVAVEIANQAEFLSQQDWLLNTRFGQVEANRNGQFYLLPAVYWLDKSEISPLDVQ